MCSTAPRSAGAWIRRATETSWAARRSRDVGEHAGPVVHLEMHVEGRTHVAGREPLERAPACVVLEEAGGGGADDADHVGHDGRRCLDSAGARALERDLADRVPLEHDRVEGARDGGERVARSTSEGRTRTSSLPSTSVAVPTNLTTISSSRPAATCAGVISSIPRRSTSSSVTRDRRPPWRGSPSSRPRQRPRRRPSGRPRRTRAAAPGRARPRSVAPPSISVRMKFVVPFTIPSTRWTFVTTSASRSTLITGIAAHTRLEAELHACLGGCCEELGATLGDELLVRRDDRLAGGEQLEDVAARRLDAAHHLGNEADRGIVPDRGRVGRQHAGLGGKLRSFSTSWTSARTTRSRCPVARSMSSAFSTSSRLTAEPTVP